VITPLLYKLLTLCYADKKISGFYMNIQHIHTITALSYSKLNNIPILQFKFKLIMAIS